MEKTKETIGVGYMEEEQPLSLVDPQQLFIYIYDYVYELFALFYSCYYMKLCI